MCYDGQMPLRSALVIPTNRQEGTTYEEPKAVPNADEVK